MNSLVTLVLAATVSGALCGADPQTVEFKLGGYKIQVPLNRALHVPRVRSAEPHSPVPLLAELLASAAHSATAAPDHSQHPKLHPPHNSFPKPSSPDQHDHVQQLFYYHPERLAQSDSSKQHNYPSVPQNNLPVSQLHSTGLHSATQLSHNFYDSRLLKNDVLRSSDPLYLMVHHENKYPNYPEHHPLTHKNLETDENYKSHKHSYSVNVEAAHVATAPRFAPPSPPRQPLDTVLSVSAVPVTTNRISSSYNSGDITWSAALTATEASDDTTSSAALTTTEASDDTTSSATLATTEASDDTTWSAAFTATEASDDTTSSAALTTTEASDDTTSSAALATTEASDDTTSSAALATTEASDDTTSSAALITNEASDDTTSSAALITTDALNDTTLSTTNALLALLSPTILLSPDTRQTLVQIGTQIQSATTDEEETASQPPNTTKPSQVVARPGKLTDEIVPDGDLTESSVRRATRRPRLPSSSHRRRPRRPRCRPSQSRSKGKINRRRKMAGLHRQHNTDIQRQ